jgi:transposase
MTDHTTMPKISRLEVIETGARRRWSIEEKRRIVAESGAGPRQVSATARRYGLSPALLFTWRRLARAGRLEGDRAGTFAEAVLVQDVPAAGVAWGAAAGHRVEIVLRDGLRLAVPASIDTGHLARLIGALERR